LQEGKEKKRTDLVPLRDREEKLGGYLNRKTGTKREKNSFPETDQKRIKFGDR